MAGLCLILALLFMCGVWCVAEIVRHAPIEPSEPSWLDTYSAHNEQANVARSKRRA